MIVLKYVLIYGYVKHRSELEKQLYAGELAFVLDCLDVPWSFVNNPGKLLPRHPGRLTRLFDCLSNRLEVKIIQNCIQRIHHLYQFFLLYCTEV